MKSDIEEFANPMPRHVAVIMDGNGRWATKRGLARKFGHRAGVKTLMKIAKHAFSVGIEYVTIYAFSTENKYRPKDEVDALVDLIRKNFATVFSELIENGVKLRVLGDREYFPKDVVEILDSVESDSVGGKNGVLNVALNYGGRSEIVRAASLLASSGEDFTEANFQKYLYTADQPDPDVIIRTGGEKRLSNFLLYQAAYSEWLFTDTLWPDFSAKGFDALVKEYRLRPRRYGKV